MLTAHRTTRTQVLFVINSRVSTHIGRSRVASATISRRKLPGPSLRPSSMSTDIPPASFLTTGSSGSNTSPSTARSRVMSRFDEKIVVITGGSSGIGLAAAQLFASKGAQLVVVGRNAHGLEAAAKVLGTQTLTVIADVAKTSDLESLFSTVRNTYGKIDVLFVN